MITQQIYSSNSTRPFPIREGSDSGIPNDLLVDMSITVPEAVDPVITAVSVTPFSFFMALEDAVTQEGIGQVSISFPAPFTVYKFEMPMTGAYGWVVPGGGVQTEGLYREIEVELDASVVLKQPSIPNALTDITVNGITHAIGGILGIDIVSYYIKTRTEYRDIVGLGTQKCIVLSRNDDALSPYELYTSFTSQTASGEAIYTLGGVAPDAAGNIDLSTSPASFVIFTITANDDNEPIGLLLHESEQLCSKNDPKKLVLHGLCDQGISSADGLPCDDLAASYNPKYKLEDCGCNEPDDQYTGTGTIDYDTNEVTVVTSFSPPPDPPSGFSAGDYVWVLSTSDETLVPVGTYPVKSGGSGSFVIEIPGGVCEPEPPVATVSVAWAYIGAV